MTAPSPAVTLANDLLQVVINPQVGGTVNSITHRQTGLSVLGQVPWQALDTPIPGGAARDEPEWLTRYTGGWPLLFPNGGDACVAGGVFHGFHGEASITPWVTEEIPDGVRLTRRFSTVPVEMSREFHLEGDELAIHERVLMHGATPVSVMWGHHPTFGSDLLASAFEITGGGGRLTVDGDYDPPANPLVPGATGTWPTVPGKSGDIDLRTPRRPMAALVYLHDIIEPWLAIRRCDNAIAAALTWCVDRFPAAWLWFELEGTQDPPWSGRTSLIGLEPGTTIPGCGIAGAVARGGKLLELLPGADYASVVKLRVFVPDGPVRSYAGGNALPD